MRKKKAVERRGSFQVGGLSCTGVRRREEGPKRGGALIGYVPISLGVLRNNQTEGGRLCLQLSGLKGPDLLPENASVHCVQALVSGHDVT